MAGYRSRAAYKLIEIDARHGLLREGSVVVDLGAAPGGWSQVAAQRVGATGRVIAVDARPMEPIDGVEIVQGDFGEPGVLEAVLERLGGARVSLVMSDMSPNISGVRATDQARSMGLAELALDFSRRVASAGLVVKVFQGEGSEQFRRQLRACFAKVHVRKPDASRSRSREVYLVGLS